MNARESVSDALSSRTLQRSSNINYPNTLRVARGLHLGIHRTADDCYSRRRSRRRSRPVRLPAATAGVVASSQAEYLLRHAQLNNSPHHAASSGYRQAQSLEDSEIPVLGVNMHACPACFSRRASRAIQPARLLSPGWGSVRRIRTRRRGRRCRRLDLAFGRSWIRAEPTTSRTWLGCYGFEFMGRSG